MSGIRNIKLAALDSNIFIYNLAKNPESTPATDIIFTRLIGKKLQAVTSIISLIEILSFPMVEEEEIKIKEDFFNTPNLMVWEIDQEISLMAARIRRKYGLKLPDAVQLATAVSSKAQVFITNDQRLKAFKEAKVICLSEIR